MNKLFNSNVDVIEPTHPEFEIALEAERDLQLLGFAFDQCASLLHTSGYVERLNKVVLDGAMPQINRSKSFGRDAVFELLVYATCVAAKLLPVDWAEPDVTFVLDDVKYGVAAKRVKNVNNIGARVREAVNQIERSGLPGVITIDASPAFNPANVRLKQMTRTVFWSEYYKNCRYTWSRYEPKVQSLISRSYVLGLVVHDYHVRMDNGLWELAGMTMTVKASTRSIEDQRLFDRIACLYTHGLPNQTDVERASIVLP